MKTQMKEMLCIAPLVLLTFIRVASCIASTCEVHNLAAEPTPKYINAPYVTNTQDGNPCYLWYIKTKYGAGSVYLNVTSFSGGFTYLCSSVIGSYVAIYDGSSTTSPLKGILCGYDDYESSSSSMTVVYNASYRSRDYFSLAYSSKKDYYVDSVSRCLRLNLTADSSYNAFSSRDISRSQAQSRCYEWHISTKHGAGKVSLYLASFSGSSQNPCTTISSSSVAIYNGNDTTTNPDAILCGYDSGEFYRSNSSSLTVVASSFFSGFFNFHYKSVGDYECTVQYLTADSSNKYLKSSDVSLTRGECYEWRISSANGSRLSLYLSNMNIGTYDQCNNLSSSYMAIYDGPNTTFPQKASLCGNQYYKNYWSSSTSMTVVYRSSAPSLDSFTIMYSTRQSSLTTTDKPAACTVVYLVAESFKQRLSLSDASSSGTGSLCYEWHISSITSKQVSLDLSEFYVAEQPPCTTSSNSYVAIYDGPSTTSPQKAVLCGYHYTGTYLSSSSKLTVVYSSSDRSRDDFSVSYSFTEVTTRLNTYNYKTEASTSKINDKTITIASTIASMVGLIASAVSIALLSNRRRKQQLSRAAAAASVSSTMALNRNPSNSSLPTFSSLATLNNSSLPTVYSPATLNNGPPPYWQVVDQNVASATLSDSKLQLDDTTSLSSASPFTTSASRDACPIPAPSPYPAHTINFYTEFDTVRPAGVAGTGSLEPPTYEAYTNIAAIDSIKAQE